MIKNKKVILLLLIVINAIVLLGQLWPEGTPPFARIINILFLVLSLCYFIGVVTNIKKE